MLGIASASMGQTLKKNAIYLSRLGCGSFSHLVFTVLVTCLIADSERATLICEITDFC